MKSFTINSTLAFTLMLILCAILTLTIGEVPLKLVWEGVIARLTGAPYQWNPLLDERLPRLIVVASTGASLAVSGAVMQALFQNPLASPSVLGISCGGSLCAVLAFMLEWHLRHPYAVSAAAVAGCLVTLLIIYLLACRGASMNTLILTGIAFSTLLIAIQGAITYALRDQWQLIQALTEWEAGSSADRTWQHVHMQLPLAIIGLIGCWYYRKELDILALGEEEARNLGIEVDKVRWRLFLFVALLTGGAVATMGIIAFFGLVLPHVGRQIQGPDNKRLIPLCIFGGATALLSLDLILRIFSIRAFSIGNVSAILGGIFFLILLFRTPSRITHGELHA